jgi:hypothetical protein
MRPQCRAQQRIDGNDVFRLEVTVDVVVAQHVQHNVGFNVVIERPQRHILHNAKIKAGGYALAGPVPGGFYPLVLCIAARGFEKCCLPEHFPILPVLPFRKRLLDKTVRKPVQLPKAITFPNPLLSSMPDNCTLPWPTVQIDEQTILQLYDHLPDAIAWYFPLFSETAMWLILRSGTVTKRLATT